MIDLNPEKEPLIHAAIKRDALLENVRPHPNANRYTPNQNPTPQTPNRRPQTAHPEAGGGGREPCVPLLGRFAHREHARVIPQPSNQKLEIPTPQS